MGDLVRVVGISGIVIMVCAAVNAGIDGALYMSSLAVVGGIVGFEIKEYLGNEDQL